MFLKRIMSTQILENLHEKNILVIGDLILDEYIYGDTNRFSPEAPVPILRVKNTEYRCGGASSVALNIKALGGNPICMGVVGKDNSGDILLDLIKKADINPKWIYKIINRPTTSKKRLIGISQNIHKQQLMRIDEEECSQLPKKYYNFFYDIFEREVNEGNIDAVCIQDYNKGVVEDNFCRKVIDFSRKNNIKVIVDPAYNVDYLKYSKCTAIKPNRKEAGFLADIKIDMIDKAEIAADRIQKILDVEAVVVTLDSEGAYLKTKEYSGHIPTIKRNVYDVTGAGDTVIATLSVLLANDINYQNSVYLSNIAGGIGVEKFGVSTVTTQEIINEIICGKLGNSKLYNVEKLQYKLKIHRNNKDIIVFTNGCFDILHAGHIDYLNFCKQNGDIVVVGLNSDESISRLKGESRPINNQEDRAKVLSALRSIDYICIFNEDNPLELIKNVKPDILIKGKDWEDKGVVGREFVESYGGKVLLADLTEGKSSTSIIKKILKNDDK